MATLWHILNGAYTNYSWNTTTKWLLTQHGWPIVAVLILVGILTACVIAINGFVILHFILNCNLLLKHRNAFIFNMAVADFLIGTLVMPMFFFQMLTKGAWPSRATIPCRVLCSLDVICCTVSIVTLCCISLDQLYAVIKPIHYHVATTSGKTLAVILAIWAYSSTLLMLTMRWTTPEEEEWRLSLRCSITKELPWFVTAATFSFYIPLLIIVIVHLKIYHVIRQRNLSLQVYQYGNIACIVNSSDDHKSLIVGFHSHHNWKSDRIILKTVATFAILWLPFFLICCAGTNHF
ncbi:unnamed protein product [Soboliphyme baturini]|uniref:G_PROTEIN_RECEP_F1_2 domain-containing protein n=1 Tax=Soboliphyme baturini TaxID=241478 RepID=A0A183IZC1_9BILA|nr:unnamed protein product [Soboliphyme baturini]